MAINSKGLGRGLKSLFEENRDIEDTQDQESGPHHTVAVDAIYPSPHQPRVVFDEEKLADLAASIGRHGILQPLLVRRADDRDGYYLIAGERRLRAAKIAGLSHVPVLVHDLDGREARILTLLENLQRENLNPMEEARGLEALRNAMNIGLGELALTVAKPVSTVANTLRLLNLDQELQHDIERGILTASHAKLIDSVNDSEARRNLHIYVKDHALTTRQTSDAIEHWHKCHCFPWEKENEDFTTELVPLFPRNSGGKHSGEKAEITRLGQDIGTALNCRAKISGTAEKGRISLAYNTKEQLNELLTRLGIEQPAVE